MRPVRVRFAPSPTGPLHIGGVRTALYNYLFAKQHQGKLLLRIEDTDSTRFVANAEQYIIDAFQWLGIPFDEGVHIPNEEGISYRQSERKTLYKKYAQELLQKKLAYIAFDTPEEIEVKKHEVANFQYDASTRHQMKNSMTLTDSEVQTLINKGEQYVIRVRIEPGEDINIQDLICGNVVINTSILDDKVLWKSSDQLPTYHLANVVDDHLMNISHVIRGSEWLPSTPLHILLYRYLSWKDTMPQFAHLPLLLKPEGNGKLSKRDGDRLGFPVFPLEWHDPLTKEIISGYREKGYFPEALINFLALLGWNPGTEQELFSLDELILHFSLDRVSKSGAKFDFEKAKWFNHKYLQTISNAELADKYLRILQSKNIVSSKDYVEKVVAIIKERANFVEDFWDTSAFFFTRPLTYDETVIKKRWKENTPEQLQIIIGLLQSIQPYNALKAHDAIMQYITDNSLNTAQIMNCLRLCLVGYAKGPDLFTIIELLGVNESVERINIAINKIKI
ncbi:MAG: glutamate--tRNA ligase [Bacteroidales bacterium]|nr:glutamate--tRNA ligase [Bacteroidales bacterium]MDD4209265.1 glutamate--tRNA ligase [Bacteroidales bacterium]